jgi:hypothetical protein
MSKAIEQLFASGIPSMAQMARMRREANNKMQGNSDSVDSSVSSPVRQSAKDTPPMVPSVTHGLEATETKPAAQNVKMKDIEVEKTIPATDKRSSIVESAPTLETITDQSPARKDNKPSISSADNGRIHQIESKKRKGNDEERKPKQKKKKKKVFQRFLCLVEIVKHHQFTNTATFAFNRSPSTLNRNYILL